MNDIFIDNDVAINLVTPLSEPFKLFLNWLYQEGALVCNQKLKCEYIRGNQTLSIVIDRLHRDGRINFISNNKLKGFAFTKTEEKSFLSNKKDRDNLKTVFLSFRKLAISHDNNFISDVNNFRRLNGINPLCRDCPSKINYRV
jgi:hypothetical protein